jgi:hypothetical protein
MSNKRKSAYLIHNDNQSESSDNHYDKIIDQNQHSSEKRLHIHSPSIAAISSTDTNYVQHVSSCQKTSSAVGEAMVQQSDQRRAAACADCFEPKNLTDVHLEIHSIDYYTHEPIIHHFNCHSSILALQSTYFTKLFATVPGSQDIVVLKPDVQFYVTNETMQRALKYIYDPIHTVVTLETLEFCLHVQEFFGINYLKEYCTYFLSKYIELYNSTSPYIVLPYGMKNVDAPKTYSIVNILVLCHNFDLTKQIRECIHKLSEKKNFIKDMARSYSDEERSKIQKVIDQDSMKLLNRMSRKQTHNDITDDSHHYMRDDKVWFDTHSYDTFMNDEQKFGTIVEEAKVTHHQEQQQQYKHSRKAELKIVIAVDTEDGSLTLCDEYCKTKYIEKVPRRFVTLITKEN